MKAFTLLELVAVIVIIGILANISSDILSTSFLNYNRSKEFNKLSYELDRTLNVISSKLAHRIKNSTIVVECNSTQTNSNADDSCLKNSKKDFVSISQIENSDSNNYPVIEWLNISLYSKRGIWNDDLKRLVPGWSGFVDLKDTEDLKNDRYRITLRDSNFSVIQYIDGNFTQAFGIDGYDNVFDNNISMLIFSGSDGRGDLDEINNSYGYYETNATKVFAIKDYIDFKNQTSIDTNATIEAVTESNNTTVYESYFIIRGANAIVPVYDSKYKDYNLTLRFNYFPWKKQNYIDGNSSLLASHITYFRYKEESGVIRVYICMRSIKVDLGDSNLTLCREKVVF